MPSTPRKHTRNRKLKRQGGDTLRGRVSLESLPQGLLAHVQKVLGALTPREEKILRARFKGTLKGQRFAVTRGRMRQIEARALRKLKHPNEIKK